MALALTALKKIDGKCIWRVTLITRVGYNAMRELGEWIHVIDSSLYSDGFDVLELIEGRNGVLKADDNNTATRV